MVLDFVILVSEVAVAVGAGCNSSVASAVVDRHGGHEYLFRHYLVYGFALRHDVLVETSHDVGSTVYDRRHLVL